MAFPSNASWYTTDPDIGLQPINDTSTTQNHAIGKRVKAKDGNGVYGAAEFIYLKGVASTAAGDIVIYDENANTTTRAVHTTAARGQCAVAMSANVASQYGWYMISGSCLVNSGANTVAAGAPVYLTSTAGQIDDAVVSTDKVDGMTTTAANGATTATFTLCQMDRPSANGNG
ncbi:MAG TPA: hypothetical protein VFP50_15375 [Anaeromyxobacteraceae bacterium]|nr:hypothetical protein [Anaeromyxobacteraceae bacterium]